MTHGSLFDGFGGMRRGFEDAGFETKWTVDLLNGQDITKLDPADFERVDLISGGPPCQKGSIASQYAKPRRTFKTEWPAMLRFISTLRPEWVVVENVPGFQRQMVDWTAELYGLGYGCAGQFIDSRHWVPQQRTRAFIVGRLGAEGMALWNHLYAASEGRSERGRREPSKEIAASQPKRDSTLGNIFRGPCSDCLPNGIHSGYSARRIASMGAGNAVTQPVAQYLAERIKAVNL